MSAIHGSNKASPPTHWVIWKDFDKISIGEANDVLNVIIVPHPDKNKFECTATMTSDKSERRIRCLRGVSILC
jgi:hypothetical protein